MSQPQGKTKGSLDTLIEDFFLKKDIKDEANQKDVRIEYLQFPGHRAN